MADKKKLQKVLNNMSPAGKTDLMDQLAKRATQKEPPEEYSLVLDKLEDLADRIDK